MKYEFTGIYKYKLLEDIECNLDYDFPPISFKWFNVSNGKIIVTTGYAWDGGSGPVFDTKSVLLPSLIHDCFYQAIRLRLLPNSYRKLADLQFKKLLIKNKCFPPRAFLFYIGLRIFGGLWNKKDMKRGTIYEI